ncbi:MAG: hypothetical protein K2Q25_12060, partial [Mycobacteriaceae bacterium]|nr:hypothetical protein [Mycobacteriaceae bacterium]
MRQGSPRLRLALPMAQDGVTAPAKVTVAVEAIDVIEGLTRRRCTALCGWRRWYRGWHGRRGGSGPGGR